MNACSVRIAATALVTGLVFAGCKQGTYTIELEAVDAGLWRSLVWSPERHAHTRAEEPAYLARSYGLPEPGVGQGDFRGASVFQQIMPQDVGGAGRYTRCESRVGTLHGYLERFRGQSDPLLEWERQQEAIDLLVDVFVAWASAEFADDGEMSGVAEFADEHARRDLKSLAIMVRGYLPAIRGETLQSDSDEQRDARSKWLVSTVSARAMMFLVERQYFELSELPKFMPRDSEDSGADWVPLAVLARAARRAGGHRDAPLPRLDAMSDWTERLETFAETHEESQAKLRAWQERYPHRPNSEETTEGTLARLSMVAVGYEALDGYDEVNITLKTGREPFATNGMWSKDDGTVVWHANAPVRHGVPASSTLVFAVWVEPDANEQNRLLGDGRLDGEQLAQYCVWLAGLSPEHRATWDEFYRSLKPGSDLAAQLEAFRFPGEPSRASPPDGAVLLAQAADQSGDEE